MTFSKWKEGMKPFFKAVLYLFFSIACFYVGTVFAQSDGPEEGTFGEVAHRVTGSFRYIARLITAAAYVAGMGFAISSIMKFKAHKDNPTQVPVGTPIALMFIAAAMIFLPELFKIAGSTVFGGSAKTGGVSGTENLPGGFQSGDEDGG